jgi:hypothetical protein
LKRKFSSSSSSSSSSGGSEGEKEKTKTKLKQLPINILLHGPRVDVVLAWLAAVWLVELKSVA